MLNKNLHICIPSLPLCTHWWAHSRTPLLSTTHSHSPESYNEGIASAFRIKRYRGSRIYGKSRVAGQPSLQIVTTALRHDRNPRLKFVSVCQLCSGCVFSSASHQHVEATLRGTYWLSSAPYCRSSRTSGFILEAVCEACARTPKFSFVCMCEADAFSALPFSPVRRLLPPLGLAPCRSTGCSVTMLTYI